MTTNLAHVLSVVNAPYSHQLTGPELARAIIDVDRRHSGQLSSFFGEVPVESQLAFAAEYGITEKDLRAAARDFSAWSGESYRMCGFGS
jgi:hypothetical protein